MPLDWRRPYDRIRELYLYEEAFLGSLRRATPDEIAARKSALAQAAAAIEPPRPISATCVQVAVVCERLAGRSNMGVASDSSIGLVTSSRISFQ